MLNFNDFFKSLDDQLEVMWQAILAESRFTQAILHGDIDKTLYAIYMIETFHYTAHNARNQALVGVRENPSPVYTKFCFEHAAEEVGHEKMALHDLRSIDVITHDTVIPKPLPETETLIAYLYWVAANGNPLRRLGYSYWAENCYHYINPLIEKLRSTLQLQDSQLTFFIAHSSIDEAHFDEIKKIIQRTCNTQDDLEDITNVMETTLKLTHKMLEAVFDEYAKLQAGTSTRYSFLKNTAAAA